MSETPSSTAARSFVPDGLTIIDNIESRGRTQSIKSVKDLLPDGKRYMTLQDLKTRLLRGDSADINIAPADYAAAIDYFRRMGGYHAKRILILGTAFQKAHQDSKGKEAICYVYPVNAPDNNIGWMTMTSNEVLTELDYVLVVSTK